MTSRGCPLRSGDSRVSVITKFTTGRIGAVVFFVPSFVVFVNVVMSDTCEAPGVAGQCRYNERRRRLG